MAGTGFERVSEILKIRLMKNLLLQKSIFVQQVILESSARREF